MIKQVYLYISVHFLEANFLNAYIYIYISIHVIYPLKNIVYYIQMYTLQESMLRVRPLPINEEVLKSTII